MSLKIKQVKLMRYQKHISISFIFFLTFLYASFSFAQSSSIANGLTYLQSTQSLEGYWGDVSEVPYNSFVDTCSVVETLNYLNERGPAYNLAVQWINATEVFNNDYLFTKVLVLAQAGFDISMIRDYLLSVKNDDGGWGVTGGFESDIKRTAVALQALKATIYSDQTVMDNAISYLLSNQNSDGGWGFYEGDESNVYMTSSALKVLTSFNGIYDLQEEIDSAVAYLLTKQNPDGGFGTSPSTVYETALAFDALVASGTDISAVASSAINYLLTTQLANGSWEEDPYSTALALRALTNVKPNLSISSADISFSNPAPTAGETITISANIKNSGPAQADNIVVQFYDGDPLAGGVLIGERTITSIPSFGSSQASISYTIPTASSKTIFVKIDPLNVIDELDETDNIASKNLTSATLPDLSITAADIWIFPPCPDPYISVGIFIKVRNLGETDASNVLVEIYNGDPASGGVKLPGSGIIPNIPAGGLADAGAAIAGEYVTGGTKNIYVLVDPQNSIMESNETNNTVIKTFTVGAGVDLAVSAYDISTVPEYYTVGDTIEISAKVSNIGEGYLASKESLGRFYIVARDSGGVQIGSDVILPALQMGKSATATIQGRIIGVKARRDLLVKVDPLDEITEISEFNNKAYVILYIGDSTATNLMVSNGQIQFIPPNPVSGDIVTISAAIKNNSMQQATNVVVEFSDGDPGVGGTMIIGRSPPIPIIYGGTSQPVTVQMQGK